MPKKIKKSKKKEKHREKKKKSKRKHRLSSSDSESGSTTASEYEWIEKRSIEKRTHEESSQHDDWMSETLLSHTFSINDTRRDRKQNLIQNDAIVVEPGQSNRELNPYWKHGGSGLPKDNKEDDSDCNGYQDAEWLKKALRRAKETAKSQNKSLESVVAERYGSLDKLYRLIDRAEMRRNQKKPRHRDAYNESRSSISGCAFMKPSDIDQISNSSFETYRSRSMQGFRKHKKPETFEKIDANFKINEREGNCPPESNSSSHHLTDQEMNSLASKILKAEIMGNTVLVKELTEKLENARQAKEDVKNNETNDKVVILTTMNSRGFAQPVRGLTEKPERKKKKTYDTHIAGERVRYFEDDDKYSLKEMFEKELTQSVGDQNAEFLRLATKSKSDKDHAVDDLFMEQTTSNRRVNERELSNAVNKQKKAERALDDCTWCLINNKLQKHLIISTSSKSYLSVPFFQSLTDGHCLIAPIYHATCTTLIDEDIWEEMLKYCKHLVKLFRSQNQDVVFFETAFNFKSYPHMLLHCVPIPDEIGELAPIYFKKAIMECEKEWAQNKQVINVEKFNVKRVIPQGLPYFMVHFGQDNGFAHVIEDEKRFPRNFAQEVIGGILDLDHRIWRKQHTENFENQCKKVNKFKHCWKELEGSE